MPIWGVSLQFKLGVLMNEEKKWTEYPLETLEDIAVLAQVIVAFMNSDETEPTGGDRSMWLSDVKLRELESKVVQNEARFGMFAKLCHQAMAKTVEPHARALLLLGILNGERRKLEDRDDDVVKDLIHQSAEVIGALPVSARKDRLDGLLDYHMGIYARVVGDYRMAAKLQCKSAEKAENAGDIKGLAISAFCEAVERLSAAIVAGNDSVVHFRLSVMKAVGVFLKNALATEVDPASVRWREMNYPCHMITSFFWAAEWMFLADSEKWLIDALDGYMIDLANAKHKPLAVLCRAIVNKDDAGVRAVWNGEVEGELHPEYKATAGLWLARYATRCGSSATITDELYNAVVNMEGPIHVVRAIATRELNDLLQLRNDSK